MKRARQYYFTFRKKGNKVFRQPGTFDLEYSYTSRREMETAIKNFIQRFPTLQFEFRRFQFWITQVEL